MTQEAQSPERAREWLKGQAQPLLRQKDGGRIDPDRPYDRFYQGVMEGGFSIGEVAPATRVAVYDPDPLPAGFAGTIAGTIWGWQPWEMLRLEAYLVTDAAYLQGEVLVGYGGYWEFQAGGRAGSWRFRLFDRYTGQQIGQEWRQEINPAYVLQRMDPPTPVAVDAPDPIPPSYTGTISGYTRGASITAGAAYLLEAYLVTDAYYLQAQIQTAGGARWSFQAVGRGGEWRFRLLDASTLALVGEEWSQPLNRGQAYVTFPTTVPQAVYPTRLVVRNPDPIPSRFTGRISGAVRGYMASRPEQLGVASYLLTDTYYLQHQVPVDQYGNWYVDAVGRAGEWRFRLIDLSTGLQAGEEWTQAINAKGFLQDVELRLYTVTDAEYLQATVPAPADWRWSITAPSPGQKMLRLVNRVTGYEYARWTHATGLVRSYAFDPGDPAYGTSFEHRCYTYDQAVALLAFLQAGDVDAALAVGLALAKTQHANGAFPYSVHQIAWHGADPYYRSGAVAWAAYALARLADVVPASTRAQVAEPAKAALAYLATLQSADTGLVRGGSGRYAADETLDAAYTIGWYSTEHNIDAWFAFQAGARLLGVAAYTGVAGLIRKGLLERCWNHADGRFWQGLGADGTPDLQGALDVHSWGALLLDAWGMHEDAARALARADLNYRVTDAATGVAGYKPYSAAEGYPRAADTLWLEGSFGVLLAKLRTGGAAEELAAGLARLQQPDGSFRYAAVRDAVYEITDRRAVASTGWFLLAEAASILWTERDELPAAKVVATAAPFYADPFGKQDSTRRLQRAVDRAADHARAGKGPRTTHVPPGVYRCTAAITIPRDVSLTGVAGETVLDFSGAASGPTLQWGPAAGGGGELGTVTGITVRSPGGAEGPPAM